MSILPPPSPLPGFTEFSGDKYQNTLILENWIRKNPPLPKQQFPNDLFPIIFSYSRALTWNTEDKVGHSSAERHFNTKENIAHFPGWSAWAVCRQILHKNNTSSPFSVEFTLLELNGSSYTQYFGFCPYPFIPVDDNVSTGEYPPRPHGPPKKGDRLFSRISLHLCPNYDGVLTCETDDYVRSTIFRVAPL